MSIRYLRKVARFPLKTETYSDEFASQALDAVSSPDEAQFLSHVRKAWHRPSGDLSLLDEGLLKYDAKLPKRCFDGDYLAILKKTLDELRPRERLIPLTLGGAAKSPTFPKSSSPGFPWSHQGFATKGDVLNDAAAMAHIHKTWDLIGRGISWSLPDSMAFQRIVASPKEKCKIRPVWGFPTEVVLEEARFFIPLLAHLKEHSNLNDTFYGLGMETALNGHSHLARSFHTPSVHLSLSSDLSNFDARVTNWIIRDVYAHVSDWFDFSKVRDSEGKIWNVNPVQTARRWKAQLSYFINTKIRSPSGMRIQKHHGVPSGSMFTNFVDTVVNAVQSRTALYRVTGRLPPKDYYFGDDSQIFLDVTRFDLDAYALELLNVFGAILSVEKTVLTNNVLNIHWLGYYFRHEGPRRPLEFIAASTLFPERPVDTPLESCARLIGQMYSTMDPHAAVLFYDATRWLLDKYGHTEKQLSEAIERLHPKSFKYLTNLGLSPEDLHLPLCFPDPITLKRYIPAVMARPSPRRFFPLRDRNLPEVAFTPEAYENRALRSSGFQDFELFKKTFQFYSELHLDEAYFSS